MIAVGAARWYVAWCALVVALGVLGYCADWNSISRRREADLVRRCTGPAIGTLGVLMLLTASDAGWLAVVLGALALVAAWRRVRWWLAGRVGPFYYLSRAEVEEASIPEREFKAFDCRRQRRRVPLGESLRRAIWMLLHVAAALDDGAWLAEHRHDGSVRRVRFPW